MNVATPADPIQAQLRVLDQMFYAIKAGLCDGLRFQLLLRSLGLALGVACLWLLAFGVWSESIWQAAHSLTSWLFSATATPVNPDELSIGSQIRLGLLQTLAWLATWFIILTALVVLMVLSFHVVVELFLMPLVQGHCLGHYPSLKVDKTSSVGFQLMSSIKYFVLLVLGLPVFLIPFLGPLMFIAWAGYLSVRSLAHDALEGVASQQELVHLLQNHRRAMLGLGLCLHLMLLIPLVGLIMAAVVAASVCHLFMPLLVTLRLQGGVQDPS